MWRWWTLPRVPEPEVMDEADEVEAYASAAAEAYLQRIDETFVAHACRLVGRAAEGLALDVGTGPGQIVCRLAGCLPGWRFVGIDCSARMIARARARAAAMPSDRAARVHFFVANANCLPFGEATFDLVLCNSVLHHLHDPQRVLAELIRVAKPEAAFLLRDLRRPSRLAFPLHVRWHGRHYRGRMYELYCASVRAAYTPAELHGLLQSAKVPRARIFLFGATHLGIERPLLPPGVQN
jgi:ubiquinone/menaquinone biosynthesis C-methylase UbiE